MGGVNRQVRQAFPLFELPVSSGGGALYRAQRAAATAAIWVATRNDNLSSRNSGGKGFFYRPVFPMPHGRGFRFAAGAPRNLMSCHRQQADGRLCAFLPAAPDSRLTAFVDRRAFCAVFLPVIAQPSAQVSAIIAATARNRPYPALPATRSTPRAPGDLKICRTLPYPRLNRREGWPAGYSRFFRAGIANGLYLCPPRFRGVTDRRMLC